MTIYKFFIGIDVSKEWIDIAYGISSDAKYLGRFDNSIEGFRKMMTQLRKITKVKKNAWFFCFENTGQYSKDLLDFLYAKKIPRREEDPSLVAEHLRLKRGKDDKSDSIAICQFAYRYRDELEVSIPVDEKCQRIKRLLARRDLLVKQSTTINSDMKENKKGLSDEEIEINLKLNKELVALMRKQIREIEKLIENVIGEDKAIHKNDELIRSIKGIGPVISAYVIAVTHNFQRFDLNARKFACYCGIVPFPNSSGKFIGRDRLSNRANKKMKTLLSNAAIVAVSFDEQTKRYYQRKLEQGKHHGTIINAIRNKMVAKIFAVVKRQTPYVDTFAYK